jgi:hypothetical protein
VAGVGEAAGELGEGGAGGAGVPERGVGHGGLHQRVVDEHRFRVVPLEPGELDERVARAAEVVAQDEGDLELRVIEVR